MVKRQRKLESSARELVQRARDAVENAIEHGADYNRIFGAVLRSKAWLDAQIAVGLHMGFFAFFQPGPPPRKLYYQTGSEARAKGEEFMLPYHRASENGTLFLVDGSPMMGSPYECPAILSECFHVSRVIESEGGVDGPKDPRFAQDLLSLLPRDASWPSTRLSPAELRLRAIIAPCGEMSASLIGWLLRRVKSSHLEVLRTRGTLPNEGAGLLQDANQSAVAQRFASEPLVTALFDDNSVLNIPIRGHTDWARRLGLVTADGRPAHRLTELLEWIIAYGDFVTAQGDGQGMFNAAQFTAPGASGSTDSPSARQLWALFSPDVFLRFRDGLNETLEDVRNGTWPQSGPEPNLGLVARLMLSAPDDLASFSRRIRFTPAAHLLLRADELFDRSWIVYPITSRPDPLRPGKTQHTGFFLGTFCETPATKSERSSRGFRHPDDVQKQIGLIRELLMPLAEWLSIHFYWGRVELNARAHYLRSARVKLVLHELGQMETALAKEPTAPALTFPRDYIAACVQRVTALRDDDHKRAMESPPATVEELVTQLARQSQGPNGGVERFAIEGRGLELPLYVREHPDLQLILAPYVHNALGYSPKDRQVSITAKLVSDDWVLSIENIVGISSGEQRSWGIGRNAAAALAELNGWIVDQPLGRQLPKAGEQWVVEVKIPWTHK